VKMKSIAIVTATALLSFANANAQDNYIVSLQLFDSKKEEILRSSSLMLESGSGNQINRKSYGITECKETSQKKTRSFTVKEFLSGYSYTVDPKSGLFEFTEYIVDDSKYKNYEKSECFNGEIKQLEFTSTHKVTVGNKEFEVFALISGNTLKLAVYK